MKMSVWVRDKNYRFHYSDVVQSEIGTDNLNHSLCSFAGGDCRNKIYSNKIFFQVGFTLIELLVVILIIALLLSILVPSLSLAKRYSKSIVCGANLRRIGVGLNLYAQDNKSFYPRALPLQNGPLGYSNPKEWDIPWDSAVCPMAWQAGYPALLAPYLTNAKISNPFDQLKLRNEMRDENIKFFKCPGNSIARSDMARRKCGFPLDYGLHNRTSQNRQTDRLLQRGYLAADQTWGLAFIEGSDTSDLNMAVELDGWWNPFIHPKDTINVLFPAYNVECLLREEFITQFNTKNPPIDDPL